MAISLALIAFNNTLSSTHNLSARQHQGICFPQEERKNPYEFWFLRECCNAELDENAHVTSAKCTRLMCHFTTDNCVYIEKGKPTGITGKYPLKDKGLLGEENPKETIAKNTTADMKSPNTDVLKDNVTLQENTDDGKEPKAPKVPGDFGGLNDNDGG